MAPETRFDVGHRNAELRCAKRSAERARRVSLDDHQRRTGDRGSNAARDELQMCVWIGHPATAEIDHGKLGHPIIIGTETGVLPGEDQPRADAATKERFGERCELDGFRTRTGDERNILIVQPSP